MTDTGSSDTALRAAVAHRAAAEGGGTVASFGDQLGVEAKSSAIDLVTDADHAAQAVVVDRIRAAYPDDPVVGEEDDERTVDTVPADGPAWVVDPIDGTRNFVRRLPYWGTAVAAVRSGDPVAAATALPAVETTYVADGERTVRNGRPVSVTDETDPETAAVALTWWWPRDERTPEAAGYREAVTRFSKALRVVCSQATLAAVADGGLDGAFTNRTPPPWDTLAGVAMIRQAGGRVTDLDGERWTHGSPGLVVSNGEEPIHEDLLAAARAAQDAADQ